MTDKTFNRRRFLESSAGVATAASLGTGGALFSPLAFGQATMNLKPEKGATLRVLRWSRFVQGDIDAYMVNVKKFTDKTGIPVRVDNEGWEDVRPKAAVAANTGAGPWPRRWTSATPPRTSSIPLTIGTVTRSLTTRAPRITATIGNRYVVVDATVGPTSPMSR